MFHKCLHRNQLTNVPHLLDQSKYSGYLHVLILHLCLQMFFHHRLNDATRYPLQIFYRDLLNHKKFPDNNFRLYCSSTFLPSLLLCWLIYKILLYHLFLLQSHTYNFHQLEKLQYQFFPFHLLVIRYLFGSMFYQHLLICIKQIRDHHQYTSTPGGDVDAQRRTKCLDFLDP